MDWGAHTAQTRDTHGDMELGGSGAATRGGPSMVRQGGAEPEEAVRAAGEQRGAREGGKKAVGGLGKAYFLRAARPGGARSGRAGMIIILLEAPVMSNTLTGFHKLWRRLNSSTLNSEQHFFIVQPTNT